MGATKDAIPATRRAARLGGVAVFAVLAGASCARTVVPPAADLREDTALIIEPSGLNREVPAGVVVIDDDLIVLIAGSDCSDAVVYRSTIPFLLQSCVTCLGRPIGQGLLSTSPIEPLSGVASSSGWQAMGDLVVTSSTALEVRGRIAVVLPEGTHLEIRFRARRQAVRNGDFGTPRDVCEYAPDTPGFRACCTGSRDR